MLLPLLAALAAAHPFAMRVVGHRSLVQIDTDRVRIVYEVAFPIHSATDERAVANGDELIAGLLVQIDGQTVVLHADEYEAKKHDHVIQTRLEASAHFEDASIDRVEVSLANYPDYPGTFVWDVAMHRSLALDDTSLLFEREGVDRIYTSMPLVGDQFRGISIDIDPGGPVDRAMEALTPNAPTYRELEHARRPTIGQWTTSGAVAPLLLAVSALLGAGAGTGAANRDGPSRTIVAAAFCGWLVWAAVLPGAQVASGLDLVGGIGLVLGALTLRRERLAVPVSALCALLLAATVRAGAAGFVVWAFWGIGRMFAKEDATNGTALLAPVSAIAGVLLILRGGGALIS